jgi:hypothetical protein
MISLRWRKVLAPIFLSLLLFVTACTPNPPSRYEQVQKETTQRGAPAAVAKKAEQGSEFNKFFPRSVGGYQVVPAQEKKGFSEYKVNKDGKNVAVLSISDTISVPSAAAKYQTTDLKISGYPAIEQGKNITGVLVRDRYQVKVQSRDASFTASDRAQWIQKFNLRGLAKLPAAPVAKAAPSTGASTPYFKYTPATKPSPAPEIAKPPSAPTQAPVSAANRISFPAPQAPTAPTAPQSLEPSETPNPVVKTAKPSLQPAA